MPKREWYDFYNLISFIVSVRCFCIDWSRTVVGRISDWIDVDSPKEDLRVKSEKAFVFQFEHALHLNLPAIMIGLTSATCAGLARKLLSCSQLHYQNTPLVGWSVIYT